MAPPLTTRENAWSSVATSWGTRTTPFAATAAREATKIKARKETADNHLKKRIRYNHARRAPGRSPGRLRQRLPYDRLHLLEPRREPWIRNRELEGKSRELEPRDRELETRSRELKSRSKELEIKNRELEPGSRELGTRSRELGTRNREIQAPSGLLRTRSPLL